MRKRSEIFCGFRRHLPAMERGLLGLIFCGISSCVWAGILDGRGRVGRRPVLSLEEGPSRLEEEVEL
jgi:hypothetical protein